MTILLDDACNDDVAYFEQAQEIHTGAVTGEYIRELFTSAEHSANDVYAMLVRE